MKRVGTCFYFQHMKNLKLTVGCCLITTALAAQYWPHNMTNPAATHILGTQGNFPIEIYTFNTNIARFTNNSSLNSPWLPGSGDGLEIKPRTWGCDISSIDSTGLYLWSTCSMGSHIRMGKSAELAAAGNRFEQWAYYEGFRFNAMIPGTGRYLFDQGGTESARIGTNRYMRVGLNAGLVNADRRLEVFDDASDQLRLSNTPANYYTDFRSTAVGDLYIQPWGHGIKRNVGIHVAAPTEKLDVEGNARLRGVPTVAANFIMTGVQQSTGPNDIKFSKIALTGSSSDVLLGNGTFGPAPAGVSNANNGLSVASGTAIVLGQDCHQLGDPAKLLSHREIPMNDYNIYFTGQGFPTANPNAVAIGYYACDPVPAKLAVFQKGNTATTVPKTIAASFMNQDLLGGSLFGAIIGVEATSTRVQTSNCINVGGNFLASGAATDIGVRAAAETTIGTNYAAYATATVSSSNPNYGVYSEATNTGTVPSYGIYAVNSGTATNNQWAGWFQGDLNVSGSAWCTAMAWTSDRRYKQNIAVLENAGDKLSKLKGYTYDYKIEEFKDKNFPKGQQIGFVAQELKELFPQLVVEDSKGYQSVNYIGIIPVLVEAFKEQQKQIAELKEILSNSVGSDLRKTNTSSINLGDVQSLVLEQNVPNPFAEQTVINYTLTDNVQKAQLLFYDQSGKLVNSAELKPVKGNGQLIVFADDLSNGIYSYTLVVDGKAIDSKQMIKTK